jgi:hypothetical protein
MDMGHRLLRTRAGRRFEQHQVHLCQLLVIEIQGLLEMRAFARRIGHAEGAQRA